MRETCRPAARATATGAALGLGIAALPDGHLLDARSALVQELRDRRGVIDRRHQLDLRGAGQTTGHGDHCFADSLVVVDFLMHQDHAEGVVIPGDGCVEVGDCDADVIDRRHQRGGQDLTGVNLIGRHHIKVT